jgi:hypothetical protein
VGVRPVVEGVCVVRRLCFYRIILERSDDNDDVDDEEDGDDDDAM